MGYLMSPLKTSYVRFLVEDDWWNIQISYSAFNRCEVESYCHSYMKSICAAQCNVVLPLRHFQFCERERVIISRQLGRTC